MGVHGFGETTLGCFCKGFQVANCSFGLELKDCGFGELHYGVFVGVSILHITIMVLSFECFLLFDTKLQI
jgi:hypothetical protein